MSTLKCEAYNLMLILLKKLIKSQGTCKTILCFSHTLNKGDRPSEGLKKRKSRVSDWFQWYHKIKASGTLRKALRRYHDCYLTFFKLLARNKWFDHGLFECWKNSIF